ncbi:hypothetical protein BOX15_Mlig031016g1 [Macrostomum lignano]|uniref:SAM domain-containing protein n=1 Tax=Macrostomum lignano TaxID=282301 RepID=A0A267G5H2_9PLAT|nr:hypothetical protein BOX15_Mlig031016g1 [Macrostomum lignano]
MQPIRSPRILSPSPTPLMAPSFRDEAAHVAGWFGNLSGPEQVSVLACLLRHLRPLYSGLAAGIAEAAQSGGQLHFAELEFRANSACAMQDLLASSADSAESAAREMLSLLPLLQAGSEAAQAHASLMERILHCDRTDEATRRSLASLALLHPAFTGPERARFAQALRSHPPSQPHQQFSLLSPGGGAGQQQLCPNRLSPNCSSGFASAEHSPLSPIGIPTATAAVATADASSEEASSAFSISSWRAGMREVPAWLKSLRLHKYAHLFQAMTYSDMLRVSEDWLEARLVTKGARNKILLSLRRLRDRQLLLQACDQVLASAEAGQGALSGCQMRSLLADLRGAIAAPVDPESDLPDLLVACLRRVCSQLLLTRYKDDIYAAFAGLLDTVAGHSGFCQRQKSLCASWKPQLAAVRGGPAPRFARSAAAAAAAAASAVAVVASASAGPPPPQWSQFPPQKSAAAAPAVAGQVQSLPLPLPHMGKWYQQQEQQQLTMKHNSFAGVGAAPSPQSLLPPAEQPRRPVERTHSAPPNQREMELAIDTDLEQLARQVTEAALDAE